MKVTIRDVAQACRVGITTVSRALNNQPGVSEATRARIQKKAGELGYRPNLSAQRLRMANSNVIAVIIKGPTNPFFTELLELIENRLRRDDYVVSIVRVLHDQDEVEAAAHAIAATKISGMILLGGWFAAGQEGWDKVTVPAVLCTMPSVIGVDRESYSSVAVDDEQAMNLIVDHLVELGHERIAFVGPEAGDESVGYIRLKHFISAMRARGFEPDPELILRGSNLDSPYSYEYGHLVTRSLIEERRDFTAVVGMTDATAVGAIRALADAGIRVPQDVAVTGFDGIDLTQYMSPRLTTITQPIEDIVEKTCESLIAQIDGGGHQHVILPGELRVAESTAGQ